jgi:hypothetical protein
MKRVERAPGAKKLRSGDDNPAPYDRAIRALAHAARKFHLARALRCVAGAARRGDAPFFVAATDAAPRGGGGLEKLGARSMRAAT